jgi:hypothetical protein
MVPLVYLVGLIAMIFTRHSQAQPELPDAPGRAVDRVRDHRIRADPGRHQREGRGVVWLAVGALVFVYFLLTGRSRELTIGEGA